MDENDENDDNDDNDDYYDDNHISEKSILLS